MEQNHVGQVDRNKKLNDHNNRCTAKLIFFLFFNKKQSPIGNALLQIWWKLPTIILISLETILLHQSNRERCQPRYYHTYLSVFHLTHVSAAAAVATAVALVIRWIPRSLSALLLGVVGGDDGDKLQHVSPRWSRGFCLSASKSEKSLH